MLDPIADAASRALAIVAKLSPDSSAALLAAFDRRPATGKRDIATRMRIAERDRVLTGAADAFFAGTSRAEQARGLAAALARYRTSAWRFDRQRPADPLRAALWDALTIGQGRTISAEPDPQNSGCQPPLFVTGRGPDICRTGMLGEP